MTGKWTETEKALLAYGECVRVEVKRVQGSAPREEGAWLIVTPSGYHGTIGGGALEWQALAKAQARLGKVTETKITSHALGPELGQCCGGRVELEFHNFTHADIDEVRQNAAQESAERPREIFLFGAGHVGRALIFALAPLPFQVRWIDNRPGAFPNAVPANVTCVESQSPASELAQAPRDAFIAIMTHSHALDLDITASAMRLGFPYVGLIGSDTKRARFEKRLKELGLPPESISSLICPIGMKSLNSKHPAVIAAGITVELLEKDQQLKSALPQGEAPALSALANGG